MAEKILYLLGAGASAQALPLVKTNSPHLLSLCPAMRVIADQLKQNPSNLITNHLQVPFYTKVADDLNWLAKEGERYSTIDTYAKFLYLTDQNLYERLKFVLSVYFTIEQVHNKKLDNRYLVWLTSLMDNALFPENVKILTWNYDFQIEITAEIFRKESYHHNGRTAVHRPPLIQYYPFIGRDTLDDFNSFSLLHLNGIAGFYKNNETWESHAVLNHEFNGNGKYLNMLMQQNGYNRIQFAWEKEGQATRIKILNDMVKDASILVVIGYSFPFFNREMDMEVYKAIQQSGKLKKIYFQDPNRDGSFLRSQFGYGNDLPIHHIRETDSLYIPFEL